MKELTRQEICEILYGCTILGTGGGGLLAEGLELVDKAFAQGKKFILANLDEIPDEDFIVTSYYCGSISPETEEIREKYSGLPIVDIEPAVLAVQAMEKYLGKEINGVISSELGGSNTAVAFYTAAFLGKYIVDGDAAGRAVPDLQLSTYYINGLPIAPISTATIFGDTAIITEVVNDFRAEALIRAMGVASKDQIAIADHLAQAKQLRKAVIPGAISHAHKIGKAYNDARIKKIDIAQSVADAGEGKIIFRGILKDFDWNTTEGFTVGEVLIDGIENYIDNECKVWFKNENILSWLNNDAYVTAPDLICMFNMDSGEPIANPYYWKGMRIIVIALPAPKEWTTERGLEVFSPRSFGFDIDYTPMWEILK
jgi:uncharacterized protein